jgi:NAD+ kinase
VSASATTGLRTVGVVPHRERPEALDLAEHAARWLAAAGIEVVVPTPDCTDRPALVALAVEAEKFADGLDLAISLGGDGTMLRTVDLMLDAGIPVLGVNVGQLGYLTEVEPGDLDAALARLVAGDYTVEERMALDVRVDSPGLAGRRWSALNEAVIEKARHGRVVRLDVDINGRFFTTYAADGVIVATPTGSTAYSFSARGPIVSPRHRCLLLTPVSPHMLFDRSLVLDPDEELRFTVTEDRAAVLTLDGRDVGELAAGDVVVCTGARVPTRVVTFGPRDFHQILKAKFGLADR